jgi:hypothetical protein
MIIKKMGGGFTEFFYLGDMTNLMGRYASPCKKKKSSTTRLTGKATIGAGSLFKYGG